MLLIWETRLCLYELPFVSKHIVNWHKVGIWTHCFLCHQYSGPVCSAVDTDDLKPFDDSSYTISFKNLGAWNPYVLEVMAEDIIK